MIARSPGSPAASTSIWRREVYLGRATAHIAFAVIIWPLATLVGATAAIMTLPYFPVSLTDALVWAFVGTILSVPDMLLVGAIVFGLSFALFNRLGVEAGGTHMGLFRLGLEPLLTCVAIVAGAAVWYPAMLSVPLFSPFGTMPVAGIIVSLAVGVVAGACVTAEHGKRVQLAAALIVAGTLSPVPLKARAELARFVGSAPTAIGTRHRFRITH